MSQNQKGAPDHNYLYPASQGAFKPVLANSGKNLYKPFLNSIERQIFITQYPEYDSIHCIVVFFKEYLLEMSIILKASLNNCFF